MRRLRDGGGDMGDYAGAKFGRRGKVKSAGRHVVETVLPTTIPLL
jgi:hypothetical protein